MEYEKADRGHKCRRWMPVCRGLVRSFGPRRAPATPSVPGRPASSLSAAGAARSHQGRTECLRQEILPQSQRDGDTANRASRLGTLPGTHVRAAGRGAALPPTLPARRCAPTKIGQGPHRISVAPSHGRGLNGRMQVSARSFMARILLEARAPPSPHPPPALGARPCRSRSRRTLGVKRLGASCVRARMPPARARNRASYHRSTGQ